MNGQHAVARTAADIRMTVAFIEMEPPTASMQPGSKEVSSTGVLTDCRSSGEPPSVRFTVALSEPDHQGALGVGTRCSPCLGEDGDSLPMLRGDREERSGDVWLLVRTGDLVVCLGDRERGFTETLPVIALLLHDEEVQSGMAMGDGGLWLGSLVARRAASQGDTSPEGEGHGRTHAPAGHPGGPDDRKDVGTVWRDRPDRRVALPGHGITANPRERRPRSGSPQ